uniref:Uncharacterized protein n=1 Tax=Eptatretus burgeri TaxID=7764 RepID=A0A8C4QIN9_EPTBU
MALKLHKVLQQHIIQLYNGLPHTPTVELHHDCSTSNPYCQGSTLVEKGDNTYGGRWVVNPSGGLIGKGHPLGATGEWGSCNVCVADHTPGGPTFVTIYSHCDHH